MIDYKLLNDSIEFYKSRDFTRVEVPWMVTEYVDSITRPKGAIPYRVENKLKNLVASGEQGFLYQYLKNYLPKGKFQATTPCFRNDSFDFTHTKYFMKNELIITDIVNTDSLDKIVDTCLDFFNLKCGFEKNKLSIVDTKEGHDIEYEGIELGSYGIRSHEVMDWIYGTGCAEPRTSTILNKYKKMKYFFK